MQNAAKHEVIVSLTMLGVCRRNKEAVYKFSQVFQQEADQEAVYNGTTAALVCMAHTPAMASVEASVCNTL
jgi:hypothetical protein